VAPVAQTITTPISKQVAITAPTPSSASDNNDIETRLGVAPAADVFVTSPLRLLGFFNETGASTNELSGGSGYGKKIGGGFYALTWAVTIAYVFAHASSRAGETSLDAYMKTNDLETAKLHGIKEGLVTGAYQSVASLFGPIVLIGLAQTVAEKAFEKGYGKRHLTDADMSVDKLKQVMLNIGREHFVEKPEKLTAEVLDTKLAEVATDLLDHAQKGGVRKNPVVATAWEMPGRLLKALDNNLPFGDVFRTTEQRALNSNLRGKDAALMKIAHHLIKTNSHFETNTLLQKVTAPLKFIGDRTPGFQLAAWKAVAGFAAIWAFIRFLDPVVEAFKAKMLEPSATHITNWHLAKNGHATYTPPIEAQEAANEAALEAKKHKA
jgi:hypothetical protein